MKYPPVFHFASVYQNHCPACGAPPLRHCISARRRINTKTHAARDKKIEKHDSLPDRSEWFKEMSKYEGKRPLPRPANLEV